VHKQLDEAVLDAYGWSHDISDEDLIAKLLSLNLVREAVGDKKRKANLGHQTEVCKDQPDNAPCKANKTIHAKPSVRPSPSSLTREDYRELGDDMYS
jgi:hypothetical protein